MVTSSTGSKPTTQANKTDAENQGTETHHDALLDACGLYCPEPVMMLHNKIRDLPVGALLKIIATDPSTQRDIPKFCHFLDHELVMATQESDQFIYLVRKQSEE